MHPQLSSTSLHQSMSRLGYWAIVLNVKNAAGQKKYCTLGKVVRASHLLSHGNADVETWTMIFHKQESCDTWPCQSWRRYRPTVCAVRLVKDAIRIHGDGQVSGISVTHRMLQLARSATGCDNWSSFNIWLTRTERMQVAGLWQAESSFNTNCRYRQFELLILPIVIADINNSNCRYQQFALVISVMNMTCWYRQIELLLSTISIVVIAHLWYRQLKLWISTMYIHYWYRQLELLISLMHIVDIDNWNCWYQ